MRAILAIDLEDGCLLDNDSGRLGDVERQGDDDDDDKAQDDEERELGLAIGVHALPLFDA
jgi:hypothetical protein